ncbi:MAG: zinc dependent phospholipase C family protein [Anaerolineae bacterium]|nr:zinc dependent phospholipase C family protein [Anaerolineae bacterium]
MPTPFQHLTYAHRLFDDPLLPWEIRRALRREAGAFYLGNTAADVQSITGQRRQETHFYTIPPAFHPRAGEVMLAAHPALADPYRLEPEHAAFVSGYLMHLVWDEVWAWRVFCPLFLNSPRWPDRLTLHLHHNALRVSLDREAEVAVRRLPEIPESLRHTVPNGWLPFAPDGALVRWQRWILAQLDDPATVQTAEVFARRMGVPVARLETVVDTVRNWDNQPESRALHDALHCFEVEARLDTARVLRVYWGFAPSTWEGLPFVPQCEHNAAPIAG